MQRLLIGGAGSHGRSVAEAVVPQNVYKLVGFVDHGHVVGCQLARCFRNTLVTILRYVPKTILCFAGFILVALLTLGEHVQVASWLPFSQSLVDQARVSLHIVKWCKAYFLLHCLRWLCGVGFSMRCAVVWCWAGCGWHWEPRVCSISFLSVPQAGQTWPLTLRALR